MCSEKNEIFKAAAKLFGYSVEANLSSDSEVQRECDQWNQAIMENSIFIMLEFLNNAQSDELIIEGLKALDDTLGGNNTGIALGLTSLARASNENIRRAVVDILAQLNDVDSINLLVSMHKDESVMVRASVSRFLACLPLEKLFVKSVHKALVWLMNDLDELVSCSATKGLMRIHAPEIYGHLKSIIMNDELGSEHFDLVEQYGVFKFQQDLAELSRSLNYNDLYESRPQWWKDSFEDLTNSANS